MSTTNRTSALPTDFSKLARWDSAGTASVKIRQLFFLHSFFKKHHPTIFFPLKIIPFVVWIHVTGEVLITPAVVFGVFVVI